MSLPFNASAAERNASVWSQELDGSSPHANADRDGPPSSQIRDARSKSSLWVGGLPSATHAISWSATNCFELATSLSMSAIG
jgi:hypothetical protein